MIASDLRQLIRPVINSLGDGDTHTHTHTHTHTQTCKEYVVVVIMRHLTLKSFGDTVTAYRQIAFCILTGSCKANYSDVKIISLHYPFSQLATCTYKTINASIMGQ